MGIGICSLADFPFGRTNYPSTRTQVAPKVCEISGAIHKKFKTRTEALEAFNRARREGTVRAVPIEPESDTASLSDSSSQRPVARDNCQRVRQQNCTQETRVSRNEPPREHEIVGRPRQAPRPATRLERYFQRKRAAASSTHANILSPTHEGPSGSAERMGRVIVGVDEPRERQNFNQESRNAPVYVYDAERPGSPSSRPVDPPTRGRSDERWQGSQHGPVGALPSPSRADTSHAAIPHREARPASTSTGTGRRLCDSPGAALSQSPESGFLMHGFSRFPQFDQGVPENAARTYGRPLTSSPPAAQVGRADIESEGSNGLCFLPQSRPANELSDIDLAFTPGSPVASSRVHGERAEKGKKRASIQSAEEHLDSFDWPEILSTPPRPQSTIETDDYPSVSALSRPPSACSYISLASSTDSFRSVFSFDVDFSAVETSEPPGRSAHASPTPQPAASHVTLSEDAIPGSPAQNQDGLSEEDDGNSPPLMIPPPHTSSGNSRPFGNLSDSTSPHRHSPQVERQPALDGCQALSRPPSPPIVGSTSRSTTRLSAQSTPISYIDTSALSPRRPSPLFSPMLLQPHLDPESSPSTETIGLGLSIEDAALPPRTEPQASASILPYRPVRSIGGQSPIRDDRSPRNAPNFQAETPPSRFRAVACGGTSGRTREMGSAAPSPHNVPLPPSPTNTYGGTSSGPSAQLQVQPRHRPSPKHTFYPSLSAGDNSDSDHRPRASSLLSPSSLRIAFGLFTPGLSPVQVPAVIRSPSSDPRSPIRQGTQIPGDIMMGLSQLRVLCPSFSFLFHLGGRDVAHVRAFQESVFRSSHASKERYANSAVICGDYGGSSCDGVCHVDFDFRSEDLYLAVARITLSNHPCPDCISVTYETMVTPCSDVSLRCSSLNSYYVGLTKQLTTIRIRRLYGSTTAKLIRKPYLGLSWFFFGFSSKSQVHFYNYTREQVRVIKLYYTCGTKVGSTAILGRYTSKQCMRHMLQLVWVSMKLCVSMPVAERCTAGV